MRKAVYLFLIGTVLPGLLSCGAESPPAEWSVASPDTELELRVRLTEPGSVGGGTLVYDLRTSSGEEIIAESPLGLIRSDQNFSTSLSFEGASEIERVEHDYTLQHGKQSAVAEAGHQRVLQFRTPSGSPVELVLRAYDDGVAFRYRFPDSDLSFYKMTREETGFHLPSDAVGFLQPHDPPTRYTPAYEAYYLREVAVGQPSPSAEGWSFPALFKLPGEDRWVLITEAGLDSGYCGTRLSQYSEAGVYRVRFPAAGEGGGEGEVQPSSTLPWSTPWRLILAGRLKTVVESTLVTSLSGPPNSTETDWIRPGRVAWSWWSAPDSPKDYGAMLPYIDLAGELGWEYFLVDANWTEMPEGSIGRLVRYGEERDVGILLWYNSGGPHNQVTEKPRDRMHLRERRREEMRWLSETGVRGIKVDFFQSDKQETIQLYLDILQDAAEFGLLVNFHGCTLPRGWSRTYPHLMTMEAVRGAESYIYDETYPEKAPWHNTILPFTRNVVGPMDYTPAAFSDNEYPHQTTSGHELALSIVYESGLQHLADAPSAYRSLPDPARNFLSQVPAAWDETRFVDGYPGSFVVLARRSGETWYVGGINGEEDEREVLLELKFLGEGSWRGRLIQDDPIGEGLSAEEISVDATSSEPVSLQPRGGFVIQLAR